MTQEILYSAQELNALQDGGSCLVVDCRFVLAEPGAGQEAYLASHIPGAVYAHLDDDLSSPVTNNSGRHPLPVAGEFAAFLGRIGWRPGTLMVVYDDAGGAIAARLWWLMKYFGHDNTAMLDGGIGAWQAAGYPLEGGPASVQPAPVSGFKLRGDLVVSSAELARKLQGEQILLVDARDRERFSGEVEPIDRVAGHVPGAVNYPYSRNLTPGGGFNKADEIRDGFHLLTRNKPSVGLVHMCGSGVTACHNIFAAELAGLQESSLYAGSWSEWIQDESRPIVGGV